MWKAITIAFLLIRCIWGKNEDGGREVCVCEGEGVWCYFNGMSVLCITFNDFETNSQDEIIILIFTVRQKGKNHRKARQKVRNLSMKIVALVLRIILRHKIIQYYCKNKFKIVFYQWRSLILILHLIFLLVFQILGSCFTI